MAGIWYQIGASFLKRKKWSWYACLIFIGLFCVGNLSSVYNSIIHPMFTENLKGVGYGRWVALILFIGSSALIKILISTSIREEFKTSGNNP